jgi:hypothetical protein
MLVGVAEAAAFAVEDVAAVLVAAAAVGAGDGKVPPIGSPWTAAAGLFPEADCAWAGTMTVASSNTVRPA